MRSVFYSCLKPQWNPRSLGDKLLANWHAGYGVRTDHLHDSGAEGLANHATLILDAGEDYATRYVSDAPAVLAQTKCVNFHGTNDRGIFLTDLHPYGDIAPASIALSVSYWIKIPALGDLRSVLTNGAGSNQGLDILTTGHYRILDDSTAITSTSAITADTWTHILITRSGTGDVAMYKDGVADATTATGFSNDLTFEWIGNYGNGGGGRPAGKLCDMRIYRSVLTADEAAQLAAGGEADTEPDWHYTLNNGIDDQPEEGDLIHRWFCDEATELALVQDTNALRPTYREVVAAEWEDTLDHDMKGWDLINGRPAIEFGGSQLMELAQAALQTCDEVFAVVKMQAVPDDWQTILSSSDEAGTANYLELMARGNTANPHPGYAFGGGTTFRLDGSTTVLNNQPMLLVFRSSGGAISVTLGGVAETLAADVGANNGSFFAALSGQDNVTVGGRLDSGGVSHEFVGHVYHIVAVAGLTAAERTSLTNYLNERYFTTYDLICDGDSIVTGTYDAVETYYPISWADKIHTLLRHGYKPTNYFNTAEGGTNLEDMTADPRKAATIASIAVAVAGGRTPIYVCQMGNGLLNNSPTNYYRTLKTFVAELQAEGALVAVAHIFHRDDAYKGIGNQGAPGWEDGEDVSALNEYLDNDPSLWDAILDWDSGYYASLAAANLTAEADFSYYFDGIHQTDLVNDPAAAHAARVISGLSSQFLSTCTVSPAITGTTTYGSTLTCDGGTWDIDGTKTYKWLRNGDPDDTDNYDHYLPIAGATSATYVLTPDDVDHMVKCVVGNTVGGVIRWASSDPTAIITSSYGDEMVTDPGFATGTGWALAWVDAPWSEDTVDVTGGVATMTQPSPAVQQLHIYTSPLLTAEQGEWYRVTVDFTEGTGGNARLHVHDEEWRFPPYGDLIATRELLSTDTWSLVFQIENTTKIRISMTYASGYTPTAGHVWTFDNVSCKKLVSA